MVNKHVWMNCFSAGVPTEEVLTSEILRLQSRLEQFNTGHTKTNKQSYSRLCNSLQRRKKMLAAVKDGQPWAWMQYPSYCLENNPQPATSS